MQMRGLLGELWGSLVSREEGDGVEDGVEGIEVGDFMRRLDELGVCGGAHVYKENMGRVEGVE